MILGSFKDIIKSSFIIERAEVKETSDMPYIHYHDDYEIYFLLKGERQYFIKDALYHILPGDLVVINRNELHRTFATEHPMYERIVINFKDNFLASMPTELNNEDLFSLFIGKNVIRLKITTQNIVEHLLLTMLEEQSLRRPGYGLYIKALLLELLIIIYRCHTTNEGITTNPSLNPQQIKIFEVIRYINEHYRQDITLSMMAEKFSISYHYLSRLFKSVIGISFVEYINKIRIREAQNLLRQKKSITIVSDEVGYDSPAHFERNFKKIVGTTPLAFKKNYS